MRHFSWVGPGRAGNLAQQRAAALRDGVDQRECQRAFAQVVAGRLAEQRFIAGEIQYVVDDLKCQSQIIAELTKRLDLLGCAACYRNAGLAGRLK